MQAISTEKLRQKLEDKNDLVLINTLPAESFEDTKIEHAINIPLDSPNFVQRVETAVGQDRDAEIVVYCASDQCKSSTQAAEKLVAAGFTHVLDYEGGSEEWHRAQTSQSSSSAGKFR